MKRALKNVSYICCLALNFVQSVQPLIEDVSVSYLKKIMIYFLTVLKRFRNYLHFKLLFSTSLRTYSLESQDGRHSGQLLHPLAI